MPSLERFPGFSSKLIFANINEKKQVLLNSLYAICELITKDVHFVKCSLGNSAIVVLSSGGDCEAEFWVRSQIDRIRIKFFRKNRILTGSEFSGKKPDADLYPAEKPDIDMVQS